jgi:hypothetical protein
MKIAIFILLFLVVVKYIFGIDVIFINDDDGLRVEVYRDE